MQMSSRGFASLAGALLLCLLAGRSATSGDLAGLGESQHDGAATSLGVSALLERVHSRAAARPSPQATFKARPQPAAEQPSPRWAWDIAAEKRSESRTRLAAKHAREVAPRGAAEGGQESRAQRMGVVAAHNQDLAGADGASEAEPEISPALSKELTHVISRIVSKVAARQQAAESKAKGGKLAAARDTGAGHVVEGTPLNEHAADPPAHHTGGAVRFFNRTAPSLPHPEFGKEVGLRYRRSPLTYLAWFTAALCVIATMLISTTLIVRHLEFYVNPSTQKYVVRILFMAPIYAMDSLLALTFVGTSTTYIDVFRDMYEAFTIYNFLKLLIVLLGGEKSVIDILNTKPQMRLLFPLGWMEPWEMGAELFYGTKYGVLQYVLVKPTCALITFVSGAAGIYGSHTFSLARLHFYVFFVSSTSQLWALYCLVTFYVALSEELQPFNPLLKFVIVKAVVFFCFWQGTVLGGLAYMGYIPSTTEFSSDAIVEALQELLVCVEMVVVSVLFHYAFPVEEFVDSDSFRAPREQPWEGSSAQIEGGQGARGVAQQGFRGRLQQIQQNAADPFRVADIREDVNTFSAELQGQQGRIYGAVSTALQLTPRAQPPDVAGSTVRKESRVGR